MSTKKAPNTPTNSNKPSSIYMQTEDQASKHKSWPAASHDLCLLSFASIIAIGLFAFRYKI